MISAEQSKDLNQSIILSPCFKKKPLSVFLKLTGEEYRYLKSGTAQELDILSREGNLRQYTLYLIKVGAYLQEQLLNLNNNRELYLYEVKRYVDIKKTPLWYAKMKLTVEFIKDESLFLDWYMLLNNLVEEIYVKELIVVGKLNKLRLS